MAGRQTLIPSGTRVAGRIDSEGDVLLVGRVEGSIRADGDVIVAAPGVAVAEITAERIEVQGQVIGNLMALDRIVVGPEARVVGDLRAPEVEITAGATIDGRVDRFATPPPASTSAPMLAQPFADLPPAKSTLRLHGEPMVRPARPSSPAQAVALPAPLAADSADATVPDATPPAPATPETPEPPRPPSRARLSNRHRKVTIP